METQPTSNEPVTGVAFVIGAVWIMLLLARWDLAMLPLYGLYPGAAVWGDPGYSERSLHIWAGILAAVYLGLFIFGVIRRKVGLAILFLVLLFGSAAIGLLRAFAAIGGVKG
jgi:hypothetical protein